MRWRLSGTALAISGRLNQDLTRTTYQAPDQTTLNRSGTTAEQAQKSSDTWNSGILVPVSTFANLRLLYRFTLNYFFQLLLKVLQKVLVICTLNLIVICMISFLGTRFPMLKLRISPSTASPVSFRKPTTKGSSTRESSSQKPKTCHSEATQINNKKLIMR